MAKQISDRRPSTFDKFFGNSEIVSVISKKIQDKDFATKCIVLSGKTGCGKTTMARIIAAGLNCESAITKPCGKCDTCLRIKEEHYAGIIEIDAASHNGIDYVREVESIAQFAAEDNYRVFIYDEVHALTHSAFQAMLKIIEEPPEGNFWILCTTNKAKVPPAIIGRSLCYDILPIPEPDMMEYMEKEYPDEEQSTLLDAVRAGDGSIRTTLTAYESGLREALSGSEVEGVLKALSTGKIEGILDRFTDDKIFKDICYTLNKKINENPSDKSAINKVRREIQEIILNRVTTCSLLPDYYKKFYINSLFIELSEKIESLRKK